MAKITEFNFRRHGQKYTLGLDWDDAAFAEGKLSLEVTATRASVDNPREKIELSVEVSVEEREGIGPALVISLADEEVFVESIAGLFGEDNVVTQAMQRIPAQLYGGDPVLGCLLRSGLSASVGQILECRDKTVDVPWFGPRTKAMGRCLRANTLNMLGKTALRAAICIAHFGG